MTSQKDYDKHVAKANERAAREITKRAAAYRLLTTEEIRERLSRSSTFGPSPWERAALHRVLRERGES